MIKTTSDSQSEILNNIIALHNNGEPFDYDPTFSKGVFYKNVPEPKYKSDLVVQRSDVIQADFTSLPFKDGSFRSICFDPPFVIGLPNKSKDKEGSNLIKNRFGAFKTKNHLLLAYLEALSEFERVLKPKGLLVFKCQDTVSSGKQIFTHIEIYNMATQLALFTCEDLFILLAKSRMSSGKWKRQVHARKYHSYFYVFRRHNY